MIKNIIKVVIGILVLIYIALWYFERPEPLEEIPTNLRGTWSEISDNVHQGFKQPNTIILGKYSLTLNMYNFENELRQKKFIPHHISRLKNTVIVVCPSDLYGQEVYEITPEKSGGFIGLTKSLGKAKTR